MWRIALLLIVLSTPQVFGQQTQALYKGNSDAALDDRPSDTRYEPNYRGKPLSFWLNSLQKRDQYLQMAFEAIQTFGPAASAAVPELTWIVSESFEPIEIGVDDESAVRTKLSRLQVHSAAVDCLTAIGSAAAPSATALAEWALKPKVVLGKIRRWEDQSAFIDMVQIDVLERMRVAGAIGHFAPEASLVIAKLLNSPNEDETKLAVAILSEHALPIASSLLKSKNCNDQKLGLKIITDMWPVVARDHLLDLEEMLPCMKTGSVRER